MALYFNANTYSRKKELGIAGLAREKLLEKFQNLQASSSVQDDKNTLESLTHIMENRRKSLVENDVLKVDCSQYEFGDIKLSEVKHDPGKVSETVFVAAYLRAVDRMIDKSATFRTDLSEKNDAREEIRPGPKAKRAAALAAGRGKKTKMAQAAAAKRAQSPLLVVSPSPSPSELPARPPVIALQAPEPFHLATPHEAAPISPTPKMPKQTRFVIPTSPRAPQQQQTDANDDGSSVASQSFVFDFSSPRSVQSEGGSDEEEEVSSISCTAVHDRPSSRMSLANLARSASQSPTGFRPDHREVSPDTLRAPGTTELYDFYLNKLQEKYKRKKKVTEGMLEVRASEVIPYTLSKPAVPLPSGPAQINAKSRSMQRTPKLGQPNFPLSPSASRSTSTRPNSAMSHLSHSQQRRPSSVASLSRPSSALGSTNNHRRYSHVSSDSATDPHHHQDDDDQNRVSLSLSITGTRSGVRADDSCLENLSAARTVAPPPPPTQLPQLSPRAVGNNEWKPNRQLPDLAKLLLLKSYPSTATEDSSAAANENENSEDARQSGGGDLETGLVGSKLNAARSLPSSPTNADFKMVDLRRLLKNQVTAASGGVGESKSPPDADLPLSEENAANETLNMIPTELAVEGASGSCEGQGVETAAERRVSFSISVNNTRPPSRNDAPVAPDIPQIVESALSAKLFSPLSATAPPPPPQLFPPFDLTYNFPRVPSASHLARRSSISQEPPNPEKRAPISAHAFAAVLNPNPASTQSGTHVSLYHSSSLSNLRNAQPRSPSPPFSPLGTTASSLMKRNEQPSANESSAPTRFDLSPEAALRMSIPTLDEPLRPSTPIMLTEVRPSSAASTRAGGGGTYFLDDESNEPKTRAGFLVHEGVCVSPAVLTKKQRPPSASSSRPPSARLNSSRRSSISQSSRPPSRPTSAARTRPPSAIPAAPNTNSSSTTHTDPVTSSRRPSSGKQGAVESLPPTNSRRPASAAASLPTSSTTTPKSANGGKKLPPPPPSSGSRKQPKKAQQRHGHKPVSKEDEELGIIEDASDGNESDGSRRERDRIYAAFQMEDSNPFDLSTAYFDLSFKALETPSQKKLDSDFSALAKISKEHGEMDLNDDSNRPRRRVLPDLDSPAAPWTPALNDVRLTPIVPSAPAPTPSFVEAHRPSPLALNLGSPVTDGDPAFALSLSSRSSVVLDTPLDASTHCPPSENAALEAEPPLPSARRDIFKNHPRPTEMEEKAIMTQILLNTSQRSPSPPTHRPGELTPPLRLRQPGWQPAPSVVYTIERRPRPRSALGYPSTTPPPNASSLIPRHDEIMELLHKFGTGAPSPSPHMPLPRPASRQKAEAVVVGGFRKGTPKHPLPQPLKPTPSKLFGGLLGRTIAPPALPAVGPIHQRPASASAFRYD